MEWYKAEFTSLWNDLPKEERERMMPYMIESQILHIQQCKSKAVTNHKKLIREMDEWVKNLERNLKQYKNQ